MNKYHAKAFWYHVDKDTQHYTEEGFVPNPKEKDHYWYFASQLEWKIFEIIRNKVGTSRIQKDEQVTLVDREIDGKKLEIIYQPDFIFTLPNKRKKFYVEGKGLFPAASKLKMKVLCITRPDIAKNLHIVFDASKKYIRADLPIYYHSLKGFEEWITTL
jgi:hypothetical protein